MLLWQLDRTPPLWWDEGWTLSVARTWIERGFYGRLLNGQFAPPGLEAAFVSTAPVALSMRLLGVGAWQGRLPDVVLTVATIGLTWYLASQLYSRAIANGTIFVLALSSNHPSVNTLLNGRQVLADIPVVFFLLLGCVALLWAWQRSATWLIVVVLAWGIALDMKAQTLPFWLVSLFIPIVVSVLARRWHFSGLMLISLAGSWLMSRLLIQAQAAILNGHTATPVVISGLYDVVAFVPTQAARTTAFIVVLTTGLPLVFGLAYAAWRAAKERHQVQTGDPLFMTRLILLLLSGSWFAWYALLSNGIPRYLASPNALAAIFVAAMLYAATMQYDIPGTVRRATDILKLQHVGWSNLCALVVAIMVPAMVASTVAVYFLLFRADDDVVASTAAYLNTLTASDALIETYDSELFLYLDRRYHYPPDPVHVELIRHATDPIENPIDYNPLTAEPNYLVVGPFSAFWRAYEDVIQQGAFRRLTEIGGYQIYERAH